MRAGSEGIGLASQFDFASKMKWGIGYIAAPGTGPENKRCGQCKHLVENLEPMASSPKRMNHLFFCGKVMERVGPLKTINPETPACSEWGGKK